NGKRLMKTLAIDPPANLVLAIAIERPVDGDVS
ncbi:MAG: hypothetical protein JWO36_5097, partial [Myxococcales bacterium]|nr:hypothetical protein [Myxococcales bacterium]